MVLEFVHVVWVVLAAVSLQGGVSSRVVAWEAGCMFKRSLPLVVRVLTVAAVAAAVAVRVGF